jgi:hypothetical protein
MQYKILEQVQFTTRTRYIIDLCLEDGEVLRKEQLLSDLDAPFGAPFGGNVTKLLDGHLMVDIYVS